MNPTVTMVLTALELAATYAPAAISGGEAIASDVSKVVSDVKAKATANTTIADIVAAFEHVATDVEQVIPIFQTVTAAAPAAAPAVTATAKA